MPQSHNLFTCCQSTKNSQADSLGPRTSGSKTEARDRTTSSQEPHTVKPIHISGTSQGICHLCHYYKHSVRCSRSQIISATRRIRAAPPEHAISSQEPHSVEPMYIPHLRNKSRPSPSLLQTLPPHQSHTSLSNQRLESKPNDRRIRASRQYPIKTCTSINAPIIACISTDHAPASSQLSNHGLTNHGRNTTNSTFHIFQTPCDSTSEHALLPAQTTTQ